jgi:hypothetical protein
VEGDVLSLRASADGSQLAFLRRCQPVKDRTLPPGTGSCELAVVAAGGGEEVRIAQGVTTLPAGFGWSPTGHSLAALASYDHAEGSGALVVWSGGQPRQVAERVTFYSLDPRGERVGWVAAGRLHLAPVREPSAAPVAGAEAIATFEFGGRDGELVLARRGVRAGGELLAVRGTAAVPVAAAVRDYRFARGGERYAFTAGTAQTLAVAESGAARPGPELGRDVQSFLFSPAGDAIAFVANAAPGKQGDLWVASLSGGAPVRLAVRVGEARWAAGGGRLAWLEDYDPRSRTGTLGTGGLGVKPAALAKHVSDFDLTADGRTVAYLMHVTAGGYSVDLGLARVGEAAAAPGTVSRGVFGFAFSPDGRWLDYRTACVREAEACDLMRISTAPAPAAQPERLAEGVKSFQYAPGRPGRLLVTWARRDRVALDLAFWEGGKLTAIDNYALPGSAQFLGGDPTRLAYAVVQPRRQGVYVVAVP